MSLELLNSTNGNRGYVVDPSTAIMLKKPEAVYIPVSGDTEYFLIRSGVAVPGYETYPTWEEANTVAQAYACAIDGDGKDWGVGSRVVP